MMVEVSEDRACNSDVGRQRRLDGQFRIARPQVSEQLIDGELVIINFATGRYHGVQGCGVQIWEWLDRGLSVERICAAFVPDATSDIQAFIHSLLEQELITCWEGTPEEDAVSVGPESDFAPPILETLDDMQDYLALDPVHDVDDRGWPHQRPAASTE